MGKHCALFIINGNIEKSWPIITYKFSIKIVQPYNWQPYICEIKHNNTLLSTIVLEITFTNPMAEKPDDYKTRRY